jgi:flavin reductase (DIM6/NTAB) family NADH-FMN oxidoreductase RutF
MTRFDSHVRSIGTMSVTDLPPSGTSQLLETQPKTLTVSASLRDEFRHAMAGVATPVSVVTAFGDGDLPHGCTVSAFASLSMDPPMVLVSLVKNSSVLVAIQTAGRFGLNILGTVHSEVARSFSKHLEPQQKFATVDWAPENGLPRLRGAIGWVACEVSQQVEGGDHIVLFGSVVSVATGAGQPLTYHQRSFGTHTVLNR